MLLLAQLGMQAHAYSHLATEKHGVPTTIQYCGECLSFAPLLGMADSAPCAFVAHHSHNDYVAPANVTAAADCLPSPAYRSRAPPPVL
ncbi:MAG TPA: hypothetical protein VKB34_14800 [Povalibacter sp.]|nr:hypothetical protein [Povalibacter sp.]